VNPDPPNPPRLEITRAELERAARKLLAHLVPAPLIGALTLPGHPVPQELRVKPEVLQPSGSVWYRGALHAALARLGTTKGIVAAGTARRMLAAACVASAHRLPCRGVLTRDRASEVEALLCAHGAETELVADAQEAEARCAELIAKTGFVRAAGPGDRDYDLGLATLALELDEGLPSDAAVVHVGSAALVEPLRAGFAALGSARRGTLAPEPAEAGEVERVVRAVDLGLRLRIGASSGRAVLAAAADAAPGPRCAVLCE
jgi:threonine dehydratase